jgi:hypothetical protein
MRERSQGQRLYYRSDEWLEVRIAQAAAESMQVTIRHADTKAATLLSITGGATLAILDRTVAWSTPDQYVWWAIPVALSLTGLGKAAWHFLSALRPRRAGLHDANRFAMHRTVVNHRPALSARQQRDDAWELAAALARISAVKHAEVGRGLPWLLTPAVVAGVTSMLAIVSGQ